MPEDYTVGEGESVNSIAVEHGFAWQTLWNHAKNSDLKSKRKDPDTLLAGDILHIPDITLKNESKGSDASHKFKVKGTPAKFKLTLMKDPDPKKSQNESFEKSDPWKFIEKELPAVQREPMKDTPYKLYADGKLIKDGTTDSSGKIETKLPPNAQNGLLIINPGKSNERAIDLNFRGMDPIETTQGVSKRLNNLGYGCPIVEDVTPELAEVLRQFQKDNKLTTNGELSEETRNKIKSAYGG
jgi:hypothetical protein